MARAAQVTLQRQMEQRMDLERECAAMRIQMEEERLRMEQEREEQRARIEEERLCMEREHAAQRTRLEEERLRFEREAAVGNQVATQVSMLTEAWSASHNAVLSTATALNPQHPLYHNANNRLQQMIEQPTQVDLRSVESQVRTLLTQPSSEPAQLYSAPYALLTLGSSTIPFAVEAGPSNPTGRLRAVSSASTSTQRPTHAEGPQGTGAMEGVRNMGADNDEDDDLYG